MNMKKILCIVAVIFALITALGGTAYASIRIYINQYIEGNYKRRVGIWRESANFVSEGGIVFIGDSHTEFYALDEFFQGYTVFNRGIYGDTTYGVKKRLDESVFNLNPSKVFILIGVNDINKTSDSNETIAEHIKDIISAIKTEIPASEINVQSLYPVNRDSPKSNRADIGKLNNQRIAEINQIIKNICKNENVIFLDIFSHLIDERGNLREEYTIEGLHLNVQGYTAITEILCQYMK